MMTFTPVLNIHNVGNKSIKSPSEKENHNNSTL